MKLWNFYYIRYSLADIPDIAAYLQTNGIKDLRQHANILIIDDEEVVFEPYLQKNGFRITHKKDIDTILDVADYTVILCDIRGVGACLGYDKEGAYLIKEIKANYPDKQVVAYTGSSFDTTYNTYLNYADYVADKGTSIDDWVAILDTQIQKAADPKYQWELLRRRLFENGINAATVADIEDCYVRAVKKKDFEILRKFGSSKDDQLQGIMTEFLASFCVKMLKEIV